MEARIDFWFDYVCPYSMINRQVLSKVSSATGVPVVWHPFELHPYGPADGGEYPRELWQDHIRPQAAGVGVRLNGGPPGTPLRRSRLAFAGYQYALEHGVGAAYNNRVFDAYFSGWSDISDPVELVAVARDLGLDQKEFRAALMSAGYAARHLHAVAVAREQAHVLTVPTIGIGTWRAQKLVHPREVLDALRAVGAVDDATVGAVNGVAVGAQDPAAA
ncbi:DsbA family oxidoreductase [Streptomyces sp. CA-111067]|uniref:DsbA family oxidoreductase n=1 Tax=Streptomyces sp. CA-111067 TaxID=3240046 RepID=UPI003D97EE8F